MPTVVSLPDGTEAEFPDSMDDAAIKAVLRQKFPPPAPKPFSASQMTMGAGAIPQQADVSEAAPVVAGLYGTAALGALGLGTGAVATAANAINSPAGYGTITAAEDLYRGESIPTAARHGVEVGLGAKYLGKFAGALGSKVAKVVGRIAPAVEAEAPAAAKLATIGEQVAAKAESAAAKAAREADEAAYYAENLRKTQLARQGGKFREVPPPRFKSDEAAKVVEAEVKAAKPMTAKEAVKASKPKSPKPMTPKEEARAAAPKAKKPMTPKEEARTSSAKTADDLEKAVVAKWEEMTRADLKTGDAAYQAGRKAYKTAQMRDLLKWKFSVPDAARAEMVGAIKQAYGLK